MSPLHETSYGDVATVFNPDPADVGDWRDLEEFLASGVVDQARGPINQILAVVRDRGCKTVVLEHRYIDRDYLSEYSAFWSSRFVDRPAQAERIHFFERAFDASVLHELPDEAGYLGYVVLRPTQLGPIGRTVIAPPLALTSPRVRLTAVVDRPSLYGHPLEVRGVPFCQQDGELLRCAHAAAWICHYIAHHRRIVGRRATADIAAMPAAEGSKYRPLPSQGLTGEQLQGVFSAVGIPAFFYEVDELPRLPADLPRFAGESVADYERRVRDERLFRVVCKYLNSGFPVVVLAESEHGDHAFTLVGWEPAPDGGPGVRLVACDDQVGPYEIIESPMKDGEQRGEWTALMIPLPREVYLTGEAAETRARQLVSAERDTAEMESDPLTSDLSEIAPHLERLDGDVRVRSRLIEGRRYKAIAKRQERHQAAARVIRMANYPLWVWVVEFQDPHCREKGEPCVLAEIVFDSTGHDDDPPVSIVCTKSEILDIEAIADEDVDVDWDEDNEGDLGEEGEQEVKSGLRAPRWLAALDGRKWRSLVSDPTVSDREYGQIAPQSDAGNGPRSDPTGGLTSG